MEIAFDRHVTAHVTPPDATTPTGRSPPGERAVETVKRSCCRFHGGKSTGPKTQAGRARVAEAQRLRWRAYRERARAVRSGDETGSER